MHETWKNGDTEGALPILAPKQYRQLTLLSLKASFRLDTFPAASRTVTVTIAVSALPVESALRRLAEFFLDRLSVTLVGTLAARVTRRAARDPSVSSMGGRRRARGAR